MYAAQHAQRQGTDPLLRCPHAISTPQQQPRHDPLSPPISPILALTVLTSTHLTHLTLTPAAATTTSPPTSSPATTTSPLTLTPPLPHCSGDNDITPYLVSRYYRPPEVILGLRYDHPMDMWAVACVLYELYTGRILFQGRSNNEMLSQFQDLKGPFPKKMLRKAAFRDHHFEGEPHFAFW